MDGIPYPVGVTLMKIIDVVGMAAIFVVSSSNCQVVPTDIGI